MLGPQHAREYYVRQAATRVADRIMIHPSESIKEACERVKALTSTPLRSDLAIVTGKQIGRAHV